MHTWIFQASPKYYDLESAVRNLSELTWEVSQNKTDVHAGDIAYLWTSGSAAGMDAEATVLSDPQIQPLIESEQPFVRVRGRFTGSKLRVRLKVERVFPHRIARNLLTSNPSLGALSIIKQPQGTNFAVSDVQAEALQKFIADVIENKGERTTLPKPGPIAPLSPQHTTSDIVARLQSEGLYFSEELVADYLLALQTKRFVILTGISGTGKTQLAIAVARHFQSLVPRVAVPFLHRPPFH